MNEALHKPFLSSYPVLTDESRRKLRFSIETLEKQGEVDSLEFYAYVVAYDRDTKTRELNRIKAWAKFVITMHLATITAAIFQWTGVF